MFIPTTGKDLYIQLQSFQLAQQLIVTLRRLKDELLPSIQSMVWSHEDLVTWLLFLFCPKRMNEAKDLYVLHKDHLFQWIKNEFNIKRDLCVLFSTEGLDEGEETTEVVIDEDQVVSLKAYLQNTPPASDVSESAAFMVRKLKESMSNVLFARLVQLSTIVYPSPYPVIRSVFEKHSADWGVLFDKNPVGCCQALQRSGLLILRSYSNRSFHLCCVCARKQGCLEKGRDPN